MLRIPIKKHNGRSTKSLEGIQNRSGFEESKLN